MQSQMMFHGVIQTGKMTRARLHNLGYPERCWQPVCTMKRPCKSFVMRPKNHIACFYLVSVEGDYVSSTLFSSKWKVAPIKPSTVPCLEFLTFHNGAKIATVDKGALSMAKRALNSSVLYSNVTCASRASKQTLDGTNFYPTVSQIHSWNVMLNF